MHKLIFILMLLLLAACAPLPAAPAPTPTVSDTAVAADTAVEPDTAVAADTAVEADAAEATRFPPERYEDLEIITLLPPDGIRAIDDPNFLTVSQADEYYDPDELVIGVEFEGNARAYSIPFLSGHEIVNDTVGGKKIAVTW